MAALASSKSKFRLMVIIDRRRKVSFGVSIGRIPSSCRALAGSIEWVGEKAIPGMAAMGKQND
jgi:hypothetical protein